MKHKLFGKFNLLDLLLIVVLLLCVAGAAVRFSGSIPMLTAKPVTIEYVYEVKQIREASVKALQRRGDLHNISAGKEYMGTIEEVLVLPNRDNILMADGSVVSASAPERYDVRLTVRLKGTQGENALFASGNQRLEAGSTQFFTTKWSATQGDIISIRVVEE